MIDFLYIQAIVLCILYLYALGMLVYIHHKFYNNQNKNNGKKPIHPEAGNSTPSISRKDGYNQI